MKIQTDLQVLLDAALTKSVLRQDSLTRKYCLNCDSVALLRNCEVVTKVLLSWRVWDRSWDHSDPHVWLTALQAIEMLVREDHPNRSFNFKQLHDIGVVNKILNICLVSKLPKLHGQ